MLVHDPELEEMVCDHAEAYIEPACCSFADRDDSGYIPCSCGGEDSLKCDAVDCTGIEDYQVDELWKRLLS